jgi:hypothetical protein
VLDGLYFKKLPNTSQWTAVLPFWSTVNTDFEKAKDHLGFFDILLRQELLGLELKDMEREFLLYIIRWLLSVYLHEDVHSGIDLSSEASCRGWLENSLPKYREQLLKHERTIVDLITKVISSIRTNRANYPVRKVLHEVAKENGYLYLLEENPFLASLDIRLQQYILKTIASHDYLLDILNRRIEKLIAPGIFTSHTVWSPPMQPMFKSTIEHVMQIQPLAMDPEDKREREQSVRNHQQTNMDLSMSEEPKKEKVPDTNTHDYVKVIFGEQALLSICYHEGAYDASAGKVIAHLIHNEIYAIAELEKNFSKTTFNAWLGNVLLSPMSQHLKDWFLTRCQNHLAHPVPIVNIVDNIMASCLAKACPSGTLQTYFMGACKLPGSIERFCWYITVYIHLLLVGGRVICMEFTFATVKRWAYCKI